ncbi:MAG: hypothetical protein KAG97_09215 [Victivallales bacterium]|nr:hypothetical protein [Victivallales bacterium]
MPRCKSGDEEWSAETALRPGDAGETPAVPGRAAVCRDCHQDGGGPRGGGGPRVR